MSSLESKSLFAILILVALAPLVTPAFAATYTITVQTDNPSYTGSQPIAISGTVTPAPGNPNTGVILTIKSPNGAGVDVREAPVDATTGTYTSLGASGGSANWISGTYTVNATWGGNGATAIQTTTFKYSPTATTTTTSSTSTSTTTSSTTTTTSSSSSSSSSSTNSAPPATSTTTVTVSSSSTSTTPTATSTTSQTSTQPQSGGPGSTTVYLAVVAAVVILLILGVIVWRRRVAGGYEQKPASTK